MPTVCPDCLKGLTRHERQNPDGKCYLHTKDRRRRFRLRSILHGKPGGGVIKIQKVCDLPKRLRDEFPKLARCVLNEDRNGGGPIWSLSARHDVRAVAHVSRKCYFMMQQGLLSEADAVAWSLTANRVWDEPCCRELQTQIDSHKVFTLAGLRAFLVQVEGLVQSGTTRLGNPTGFAGAHTGLPWLTSVCENAGEFQAFKRFASSLVSQLRAKRGGASSTETLWKAISKPKTEKGVRLKLPKHTGIYNQMQSFRVLRHAYHRVHPDRAHREPCQDSKELWEGILLKYDQGGANRKSLGFGVKPWKNAARFCQLMRRKVPGYCMCDLACWICLA